MKKIFTIGLTVAMLASMAAPVMADDVVAEDVVLINETAEEVAAEDVVLIAEDTEEEMKESTLSVTEAEVTAVKDGVLSAKAADSSIEADINKAVVFDLSGAIIKADAVKEGDKIALYYDKDEVKFAVVKAENVFVNVDIDVYTKSETLGEYVNSTNMLALNLGDDSNIVDVEGNKLTEADIENSYIAVFYDMATMSIPAQTNPLKVVVLEQVKAEVEEEVVEEDLYYGKVTVAPADIIEIEGVKLVPVRKLAESVKLEVKWNHADKSVSVGTVPMGVNFKIGENLYNKSRMTPAQLEIAPQLVNDTTYVPFSFFEEILQHEVVVAE